MNFHLIAISEIQRLFTTNEHGLPSAEIEERQNQYADDGVRAEILHHEDSVTYALSLYDNLRAADMNNCRVVLAVLPPDEGLGTAIRDRLTKAAASN
jgi:hypothetical protein